MTPTTPPQIRARCSLGAMVAASIVSAVCGVAQTFWIPRVLSVNDYGYWRMFLLYIRYAGLLHFNAARELRTRIDQKTTRAPQKRSASRKAFQVLWR